MYAIPHCGCPQLKSEDLAKLVAAAGDEGRPIAFCIGGPYGHSDAVRGRADRMIRLSSMVLNHQVRPQNLTLGGCLGL